MTEGNFGVCGKLHTLDWLFSWVTFRSWIYVWCWNCLILNACWFGGMYSFLRSGCEYVILRSTQRWECRVSFMTTMFALEALFRFPYSLSLPRELDRSTSPFHLTPISQTFTLGAVSGWASSCIPRSYETWWIHVKQDALNKVKVEKQPQNTNVLFKIYINPFFMCLAVMAHLCTVRHKETRFEVGQCTKQWRSLEQMIWGLSCGVCLQLTSTRMHTWHFPTQLGENVKSSFLHQAVCWFCTLDQEQLVTAPDITSNGTLMSSHLCLESHTMSRSLC